MAPAVAERWQRICETPIGPAAAVVGFEDKLVRETGWTRAHAVRAIDAYRRFLLLAAEAGHPVSPSPDVDRVWHLHLLYTRDYWEHWCPHVLARALHHEPATGDRAQGAELDDWYARTRESYRAIFGEPPEEDLWPTRPRAAKMLAVDPERAVVLPRRVFLIGMAFIAGGALLGAVAILALLIQQGSR